MEESTKRSRKQTAGLLKRFIAYYKPHKKLFAMDMTAALLVAVIGVVYPIITRTMLNTLIPDRNYRMIVIFGITLLALYFIKMLLNYFIQYEGHMMGVYMQARMRTDMFAHLETLPYSFYDTHETGKIMSRMTNDLFEVSELAHHGPENIIISVLSIVISFVYLSTIDIWLTLIIFACVPFLIVISWSLRKKMRQAFRDTRTAVAEINASMESSISGIRVTKAFTNAEKEKEKFEIGNGKFQKARQSAYSAMGRFHSGNTFVTRMPDMELSMLALISATADRVSRNAWRIFFRRLYEMMIRKGTQAKMIRVSQISMVLRYTKEIAMLSTEMIMFSGP